MLTSSKILPVTLIVSTLVKRDTLVSSRNIHVSLTKHIECTGLPGLKVLHTRSHGRNGPEEHANGVPAADGVAVLLEVGGEGIVVQRLDYVHPGVVQSLFGNHNFIHRF